MTPDAIDQEVQQHLWRITELKAELHDEEVAVAHLTAIRDAAQAGEESARLPRAPRGGT